MAFAMRPGNLIHMRTALAAVFALTFATPIVARADEPTTAVVLDGANERVVLARASDGTPMCGGACSAPVPSGVYRIAGANVQPSEPFVVDGASARYALDVRSGNPKARRVGTGLMAGGLGGMILGGILLGVSLATMNQSCSNWFCIQPSTLAGVGAGIFGGAGFVLLVSGGALLASSSSAPTTVQRMAGVGFTKSF
jgi:hypothetical protein